MFLLPYHKFEYDGGIYVLSVEQMLAARVDEATAAALDKISSDPDAPVAPEVMDELARLSLTGHADAKPEPGSDEHPPIDSATFLVTQTCNLRCVYCYAGGGDYGEEGIMEEATALRAADWLIDQARESRALTISFSGGEPLLNFPVIERVVEYVHCRAKEAGKQPQLSLSTNGTLLDDERIAFLKANNIRVRVSFDGPADVQNVNRPFGDGRGSYETVAENLCKLLSVMPEGAVTCAAKLYGSTDPRRVVQAARELGFAHCSVDEASPARLAEHGAGDRWAAALDPSRMMGYWEGRATEMLTAIKSRDDRGLVHVRKAMRSPGYLRQLVRKRKRFFPCRAGRDLVAISARGDVYPCQRFVGLDAYKIGNIRHPELARPDYLDSPIQTVARCSQCWARYFCAGRCRYDHLAAAEPCDAVCEIRKFAVEMTVHVWCQLDDSDWAYLADRKVIRQQRSPWDFLAQG